MNVYKITVRYVKDNREFISYVCAERFDLAIVNIDLQINELINSCSSQIQIISVELYLSNFNKFR